jgi:peptidoglycan/LPS O-acetylase OafA/YrhL
LLDFFRSLASLLVVLGHTRYLYFGTPTNVANSSGIVQKAFYFLTGLHHEAVVFFFVISGFLVGGQIIELNKKGVFDAWAYFINRFVRIYIVFIPALALAFILNWVGANIFIGTSAHTDLLDGWAGFDWPCFMACLQGIECEAHANPPLWSLGYEWLLYLLAPAFFGIIFSSLDKRAIGIALVLFAVIIYAAFHRGVSWEWFLFWLIGAVAQQLVIYRCLPISAGFLGLIVAAGACAAARMRDFPLAVSDTLIAVAFGLAISSRLLLVWHWGAKASARMAAFSYSLYAIHLPVVVFIARMLERLGWADAVAASAGAGVDFLVSVVAALLAAICFAWTTENRTDAVRRMFLRYRKSSV